jgi:hypothetical protein
VRALLEAGAVVGAATKEDGLTALHFAAQVSAPPLCPHTNL